MSKTTRETEILSDRLAKGDCHALGALFELHSGQAMSVALRILRVRAEAEEVVQEAFLEAWQRASHYQPERARFDTWITTIARSRALDRLRARRSQARATQGAALEAAPAEHTRPPDEQLESQGLRHTVRCTLFALPSVERETLKLAYRDGLSQSMIATRTGTPLGTVKTRMRMATQRLAMLLAGHDLSAT